MLEPLKSNASTNDTWRWSHMGRLLGESLRRFDERVMTLMAHSAQAPLALANLASRGKVSAAIIHITRHLPTEGARLTWLAEQAGMSKQAMATLIDECEAWDLVARDSDPQDARAKRVVFTAAGLEWLKAFELAVAQAEGELREEMGEDIARVVAIGLESYARSYA
jgi:DNA-binding MarR family transcriptional regulator